MHVRPSHKDLIARLRQEMAVGAPLDWADVRKALDALEVAEVRGAHLQARLDALAAWQAYEQAREADPEDPRLEELSAIAEDEDARAAALLEQLRALGAAECEAA